MDKNDKQNNSSVVKKESCVVQWKTPSSSGVEFKVPWSRIVYKDV